MPAPSPFNNALQQLQSLHDDEVAHLRCENDRLFRELQRLRRGDTPASVAAPPRGAGEIEEAVRPGGAAQELARRSMSGWDSDGPVSAHGEGLLGFVRAHTESQMFDSGIGVIICANAVTIGIETSYRSEQIDVPSLVVYLEYIFLAAYTVELSLRFIAAGPRAALVSNWVKLDLALVLCGYLDLLAHFLRSAVGGALNKVLLIRILRLARLVRLVRRVVQFRNLYLLVSGLMNSLLTLVWTGTVIFVLIYCFSILGLELIEEDASAGDEYNETVRYYFNGLFNTMLTLLQGATLDSVGGVYRPLISAKPYLFCYFIVFILLVSIALMNLVTAIMVEAALDQGNRDRETQARDQERKKREHVEKLEAIFHQMDADGSGTLSFHELRKAHGEVRSEIVDFSEGKSLKEVFQVLDYDSNGEVDIKEFCDGMMRIESGTPMEIFSIQTLCSSILKESRTIRSILSAERPGEPQFERRNIRI